MADELTIHRDNASYNRMRQAAWFSSVVPKPGTEKGPLQVDTRLGDRRVGATNPLGPQQPSWTGAETSGPGHGSGFSFLILELVSGESRSRSSCSPSGVGFSSHSGLQHCDGAFMSPNHLFMMLVTNTWTLDAQTAPTLTILLGDEAFVITFLWLLNVDRTEEQTHLVPLPHIQSMEGSRGKMARFEVWLLHSLAMYSQTNYLTPLCLSYLSSGIILVPT